MLLLFVIDGMHYLLYLISSYIMPNRQNQAIAMTMKIMQIPLVIEVETLQELRTVVAVVVEIVCPLYSYWIAFYLS